LCLDSVIDTETYQTLYGLLWAGHFSVIEDAKSMYGILVEKHLAEETKEKYVRM
jgi:hypothetical protein